jgi:hypothetical protein
VALARWAGALTVDSDARNIAAVAQLPVSARKFDRYFFDFNR